MWVFVVITFSIIGFVWFRSTEKKFVALLNPEEAQATRALAESTKSETGSPFATILNSLRELKANISELVGGSGKSGNPPAGGEPSAGSQPDSDQLPPQKLPLSGNK